jgi:hypothetical protein
VRITYIPILSAEKSVSRLEGCKIKEKRRA